ncbi:XRE family transcriptional regulator [Streptomyces sp. TSRI0107]|uniref:XRE family transcriptional regulator n=1 Tax=Streptomyces sp. TSRI0107 TaxID=1703942 RepID=UPI00093E888B|nr:XRE family transcriptional regulator [Streptomyces sp. TSRI0107]
MGRADHPHGGQALPRRCRRIRALRKQCGWAVQQLADAAKLSRRMLTDIELGKASPSLATVDRVARTLDTDFAALALPENDAQGADAEGTRVWQSPDGSTTLLLGTTENPQAELWRWTLAPGGRYDAEPDRPGAQELHHVLSGRLTLALEAGRQEFGPGQSAVIASDQQDAYLNEYAEPAVFMRVSPAPDAASAGAGSPGPSVMDPGRDGRYIGPSAVRPRSAAAPL